MRNTITELVREAAAEALADLKAKPRPLGHLATGHSDSTVRRALALMREAGAPITFDRGARVWRIDGSDWVMPPHLMTRAALERAVEALTDGDDDDDPDTRAENCITSGRLRTVQR